MVLKELRIVHFNDVYQLAEFKKEPIGGAARFLTAVSNVANAIVLFSGDVFSPSLLSGATKGAHMIEPLNAFNITAATYGNHDFDFGEERLIELSDMCNFPWILSNLHGKDGKPPARGVRKMVLEKDGLKIGLMGLAEEEWIETLSDPPENLQYTDFMTVGKDLALELREGDGCDIVIALTHMREHNDQKLAKACPEIDLVLGGHDHYYSVTEFEENGNVVVKSGCDFRQFSIIHLKVSSEGKIAHTVERVNVTADFEPEPELQKKIIELNKKNEEVFRKVVGSTEIDWNVTSEAVRTKESPLGNFTAGVVRARYGADMCLLVGGTFRSDSVYSKGPITVGDVMKIFPFKDPAVVVWCTGETLLEALENGVSEYPSHSGRFPQISGFRFAFDPEREPGKRVLWVTVGEDRVPLDMTKKYKLASREYLCRKGGDGYQMLTTCKPVFDFDNGSQISTIVINALTARKVVLQWKHKHHIVHTAIAAFRGAREDSCHRCLNINPGVDGRIEIAGVTKEHDLTMRPPSVASNAVPRTDEEEVEAQEEELQRPPPPLISSKPASTTSSGVATQKRTHAEEEQAEKKSKSK